MPPDNDSAAPIIACALMEESAFAHFNALRRAHFPSERNYIAAHITLFHHLPGPRSTELVADLKTAARHETAMPARAVRVHMMGRGVAFIIDSPLLSEFRARLADRWRSDLIPQDRQGFRPHVTVQNKVEPQVAKTLHQDLSRDFTPFGFEILGVSLWWYRGGPWEKLHDVRFRA